MNDALIGHSGFVGTTLLRQRTFDHLFRSTNIDTIQGRHFSLAVCAAAPAQKWLANRDPDGDRRSIDQLIRNLDSVRADCFVLISTVDVFKDPCGVDEHSAVDTDALHAYGSNRYRLEQFVRQRFARALIVRLPGLVGPHLRKNVLYDFKHDNNIAAIDTRGIFQFYPMVNLWRDIGIALAADIELLHLTAEPIAVEAIAREAFGLELRQEIAAQPARYDMRTVHAGLFGRTGAYQYDRDAVLLATRCYAQS